MTLKYLTGNISIMDEGLKIDKLDEKKIRRTKKTISWIFGFIGILIILSQAIPLLSSYIQGEFELFKQGLIKDPLPDSILKMNLHITILGRVTLRISLRMLET